MSVRTSLSPKVQSVGASEQYESMIDFGTGPKTIVFLHGLFGTPGHWTSIMEDLSDRYRVIAPQLPIDRQPGRRLQGVKSIAQLTASIEGVIDSVDAQQVVLCGNSLGGLISIDYSLRYPDRVAGLVLAGSAGLYERSLTNGIKPHASRDFVRSVIADIFHNHEVMTDELIDEWYQSIQDRDYARFLLRLSRATRDRCVEGELGNLKMPTLIVWGRNDEITPPHVAEQFKDQIKGSRLEYIDNCGHAPNLEQPKAFASILDTFLPMCFPNGLDVNESGLRSRFPAR
jgi:pimeloyl-ACP methyl ester carboxylesterase